jgi:hypothetical protein
MQTTQALCMCTTRELVAQNLAVLRRMAKYTGITSTSTSDDADESQRGRKITEQVGRDVWLLLRPGYGGLRLLRCGGERTGDNCVTGRTCGTWFGAAAGIVVTPHPQGPRVQLTVGCDMDAGGDRHTRAAQGLGDAAAAGH